LAFRKCSITSYTWVALGKRRAGLNARTLVTCVRTLVRELTGTVKSTGGKSRCQAREMPRSVNFCHKLGFHANKERTDQEGTLVLLLFGVGTMLPCIAIALSATNPRVKAIIDFLAWGLALCNLCGVLLLARSSSV
jgi:hypothetical protein